MSYVCQQNSTWHIWKENDIGNGLNVEILPQIFPSSILSINYGSTFVFLMSVMYSLQLRFENRCREIVKTWF